MPIRKDVILGARVKIHQPNLVNIYGCYIGDDSSIGTFVEIQKGVVIGKKVKIQTHAFIPTGIKIEDEVFIGPHVCFTNDLFPRATNYDGSMKKEIDWKLTPTLVKKKASLGANATIRCGITIGIGSMVGAGSLVLSDVADWVIVAGNPAKTIGYIKQK